MPAGGSDTLDVRDNGRMVRSADESGLRTCRDVFSPGVGHGTFPPARAGPARRVPFRDAREMFSRGEFVGSNFLRGCMAELPRDVFD